MGSRPGLCSILVAALAAAVASAAPEGEPPASEPVALPPIPRPRLAPLNKAADEAMRLAELTKNLDESIAQARESQDASERATRLVDTAGRILALQIEPFFTDRFLRIDRPDRESSRDAARRAIDGARSLLTEASDTLAKIAGGEPNTSKQELERSVARLDAFAGAVGLYLNVGESLEPGKETRQAISKLAPLLESSDLAVAGAAGFWRACLQSLDPDPRVALAGLELAVADVPAESSRYGFFKRLLRCRLIAATQGEPAALALLSQVEERIDEWLHNEPDRLDAIRTVGLFQLQVLRSWHDRLDTTTQAEERAWCVKESQRVMGERFGGGDNETVLRLVEAIPLPKTAERAAPQAKPEKPDRPLVPPPE